MGLNPAPTSLPPHLRHLATGLLTLLLAALGLWLRGHPTSAIVRESYDTAHALGTFWTALPAHAPVLVVYLDSASYTAERQDPGKPWDRALHARLLERLSRAGARAVVFDILFEGPGSDAEANRRFRDAIRDNGKVMLAGELEASSHGPEAMPGIRSHTLVMPDPTLAASAAGWGLANLQPDPDFVIRRHFIGFEPDREPGLTWATARFLQLPGLDPSNPRRWVRYYGPALTLPHVSYTYALDPGATADALFSNRVVFVGARPMTAAVTERRDEFRNPLAVSAETLFMPAVEVHATQMLNLLRGDALRRPPAELEGTLICLGAWALAWGLVRLRPWPAVGAAFIVELAMLGAVTIAFRLGAWGAWLVVAAVQVPLALGGSVLVHSFEWYQTRRRLEAQLLRTQRLQTVGALASGMAHDLNHALAPVLLGVQRLRQHAASEEARSTLAAIEASTRRGAEMVRQVLAFARGHDRAQELLNPGRLLEEVERIASPAFPATIRFSVLAPPDLWPVLGNATQLHQVLFNLCLNARDAMPQGGEITLAADNVRLEAHETRDLAGAWPGEYVMLLVADQGTGIPPEVWPRLFEPFFTTKKAGEGTGLGLSTSSQLVRAHGGFINVRSETGAGSTFEIYLPRASTRPLSARSDRSFLAPGQELPLVLIQPESALHGLLRATLEAHGCRVFPAGDAAAGLAALNRHAATVRAVLLDHDLAGADSLTTLAAIRAPHPHLPVILLGGDRSATRAAAPDACTRWLPTPFDTDELLAVLQDLCDRRARSRDG